MKLPNAEQALVEREKIEDYLLNANHPFGASKAQFFTAFGFSLANWRQLAEALRVHGRRHSVKQMRETGFGPRYEVEGSLEAPDGRSPRVRSVWQWDHGAVAPRLLTAYPVEDQ